MVLLKKKEVTKDKVTYYYQPEKKGEFGVATYDPKIDDLIIEKQAESDFDYPYSGYKVHTAWKLREFYENNEYPEEKLIKWG